MINEEDIKTIEENIVESAKNNNWELTNNLHNIAKAKCRLFGLENWRKCPCYPKEDNIHGCETEACSKMIEEDGVCHCNLFKKVEK